MVYTTYSNGDGDDWGVVYYCFNHIENLHTIHVLEVSQD